MKRFRAFAAWLAVVALLIDGLLPTAVAAAALPGAASPLPLCRAASGGALPGKHAPTLPARHCALCAGCIVGMIPAGHGEGTVTRFLAGTAHSANPSGTARSKRADYAAAQPRGPPRAG